MAKFKIGDRVKCVNDDNTDCVTAGDEYVVRGYDGEFITISLNDGREGGMSAYRFELVPAWQPKIGDRVRLVKDGRSTKRAVGKLATVSSWSGKLMDNGEYLLDIDQPVDYETMAYPKNLTRATIDCFEPVPVAAEAQPAALTIEAGKFYKTRDGRKVGPVTVSGDGDTAWGETSNGYPHVFTATGLANYEGEHPDDYIAEWVDEPAEQPAVAVAASNDNAAPAKFKMGDRISGHAPGLGEVTGEIVEIDNVDPDHTYRIKIANNDWPFGVVTSTVAAATATAIVALIENGQPKPATRPYVHATEAAAAKEAARLASVHKGQQFGVYVLTTTIQEPAPTYAHVWQRLAAKGEKIAAIKELRSVTGMPLRQSKDVVEHFINFPYGQLAA